MQAFVMQGKGRVILMEKLAPEDRIDSLKVILLESRCSF